MKTGSEIKIGINIQPLEGLRMSDYEFKCKFYTQSSDSIEVVKADMIKIDDDNYVALVDTSTMAKGKVRSTIYAYIPDLDFPDGVRTEVHSLPINLRLE